MKEKEKSKQDNSPFPYITEQLKVSRDTVRLRINVLFGQEGDMFIAYCPSLEISGYGATKAEAKESFEINLEVFADDVLDMSAVQQHDFLVKLGWQRAKYKRKQFSRAYVDENGNLQNLKNVQVQPLEFA